MTALHIGATRKAHNLTQDALAQALGVPPQAVSKWEQNLSSYPDIALMPVIANYFEISLDTLFDFDAAKKTEKIEAILRNADKYFLENTKLCIEKIQSALLEYPKNETLLHHLLECFEFDFRSNGCTDWLEDMLAISEKLIQCSQDFEVLTNAKEIRAAALLATDQYEEAKKVLLTLPDFCRDRAERGGRSSL